MVSKFKQSDLCCDIEWSLVRSRRHSRSGSKNLLLTEHLWFYSARDPHLYVDSFRRVWMWGSWSFALHVLIQQTLEIVGSLMGLGTQSIYGSHWCFRMVWSSWPGTMYGKLMSTQVKHHDLLDVWDVKISDFYIFKLFTHNQSAKGAVTAAPGTRYEPVGNPPSGSSVNHSYTAIPAGSKLIDEMADIVILCHHLHRLRIIRRDQWPESDGRACWMVFNLLHQHQR